MKHIALLAIMAPINPFLRSRDRSLIEAVSLVVSYQILKYFSGRATGASLKPGRNRGRQRMVVHFSGRATGASLKPAGVAAENSTIGRFLRSRDRSLIEAGRVISPRRPFHPFLRSRDRSLIEAIPSDFKFAGSPHFSGRATGASLKPRDRARWSSPAEPISPVARPEPH